MSRLDPVMKNLIGTESPDDLAQEILGVLTEGSNVPEAGNFYVFSRILTKGRVLKSLNSISST